MKLLAVGDSFTYGDELEDRNSAWPSLLAEKLNGTVLNKGQPGGSNDCIVRNCVETLLTESFDMVVIGWANPGRSEFVDERGYYDIWPGYAGKVVVDQDRLWRNDIIKYINEHHSSEAYHEKFLMQVLLMQGFLKSKGIRYVMLNTVQNEHYKKTKTPLLEHYLKQVDKESFVGFNHSGMAEWTFGCQKGPRGHFLEEGHVKVADRIYEHIGNIGWLS